MPGVGSALAPAPVPEDWWLAKVAKPLLEKVARGLTQRASKAKEWHGGEDEAAPVALEQAGMSCARGGESKEAC